jgi:hypothetical protein
MDRGVTGRAVKAKHLRPGRAVFTLIFSDCYCLKRLMRNLPEVMPTLLEGQPVCSAGSDSGTAHSARAKFLSTETLRHGFELSVHLIMVNWSELLVTA